MAQFCTACGKEIDPGLKFCVACGAPAPGGAPGEAGANEAGGPAPEGAASGAAGGGASAPSGGSAANAGSQVAQQFFDGLKKIAENTADHTEEMEPADVEKNKAMSCAAYILFLFFVPLVTSPDSKFGRYHANQGLLSFILLVAGVVITRILYMIFRLIFLGWLINIVTFVFYVAYIAIVAVGIMNSYAGKAKDLPFIGTIRLLK